ncbi:MAG: beta-lactamase family protein [Crocinitomicaceae bacterium]|nr:beta-lactamase family protein [Crocinitomicaceae bacterium]
MKPKIILTVIAAIVGIVAMAQSDLKLKLDSIANSGIEKGIPGMQILITDNNGVSIYNYGSQDIKKTNKINDSTNWRYGSITKLFTAVIILQLESEGKLSINDSVSKYVDLKQHNEAGITIKQLLNHTSGLYNYTSANRLKWEDTMNQCLEYSLKRKLNFTPGSEYSYCNTGYVILGLIIEKVTELSYQQNITERIFEPCGLESMIYCNDEKTPSNTARGYNRKRKKYKDFTEINHSWANSAGAVLGNLSDLNQFVNCLFNGSLIDSVQLKNMITRTIIYRDLNAEGLEWFYHAVGLCWDLNLDKTEKTIYVSHGGNTQGYNCDIHYNTQNNLTIVIGMNLFPSGEYEPVFSTQNQLINTIHEYYKKEK